MNKKGFFNNIIYIESIDSTNSELLEKEYPDRTVLYTFNQTAGRGRFERKWINLKDKALAFSILIKNLNNFELSKTFYITSILAISCIDTIKDIFNNKKKLNIWIKWPNDIYINNKKLAGILTETKVINENSYKITSGIGININLDSNDIKQIEGSPTSLFIETGILTEIQGFTIKLLEKLNSNIAIFLENDNSLNYNLIKDKWKEYSQLIGKNIIFKLNENNKLIEAKVIDIDDIGHIVLKIKNNKLIFSDSDIKIIF
ncbi:MAG: biotin--[acetyl-CoA-carboxylase] ligase [Spirochaetes bacterium]|nr:biotin--[acetyl-CoA-carboxylase] ligase [Spirochaetota bacterium]